MVQDGALVGDVGELEEGQMSVMIDRGLVFFKGNWPSQIFEQIQALHSNF